MSTMALQLHHGRHHHRHQAVPGGDIVMGTACMPQGSAAGGGVNKQATNAEAILVFAREVLKWVYDNRRYAWLLDYTILDLKAAARELGDEMQHLYGTISDAQSQGFLLFKQAKWWLREGMLLLMHRAGPVVVGFNELAVPDNPFHWDPCYATSRCKLNFEAVMWLNRIKEHLEIGRTMQFLSRRFEDVAMDPRKRASHGLAVLSEPGDELLALDFLQNGSIKQKFIAAIYSDHPTIMTANSPGITRQQISASTACQEKISLRTFPELRAVPASQNRQKFLVLVSVKAPIYTQLARAPIDLVMVLDMSTAMASGLQHIKQGAKFAILNLREQDRLSVVTHGPTEEELSIFTHMSDQNKSKVIEAVESLVVKSRVHISHGLKKAYEVLHNRSEKNRVGGILLLSDGKDKQILRECQEKMARKSFEESDTDIAERRQFPTYTFGFGTNHDPRTLYYLAREGYGTYSFASEEGLNIEDAMALCIGGLTSIVSQDVDVTIEAAHPEVKISEIKSGLHKSDFVRGRETRGVTIKIKDLYGDEEKNLLVCVNVPEEEGHHGSVATLETSLLTVKARYRDPLTNDDNNSSSSSSSSSSERNIVMVDEVKVRVERPPAKTRTTTPAGQEDSPMSPEVETEIYRAQVLDRVASIWNGIADACHHHHWTYVLELGVKCWSVGGMDKKRVLGRLDKLLGEIDPTADPSPNPDMAALRRKLYNDVAKMRGGMAKDVEAGLPYMLSWLSSHGWQRAATRAVASDSSFLTVRMHNMIASVETALAK